MRLSIAIVPFPKVFEANVPKSFFKIRHKFYIITYIILSIMKIKTSVIIIAGCLGIFIFIMLPIFLSVQGKKDDYVASLKGSEFSLKDVNNNLITEKSFEGPLTAIFFGFTNCPDVCPMTLIKWILFG